MNTSSVYKVQCYTCGVMKELTGIRGNVSTDSRDPRFIFRVVPKYRSDESLALRKRVADEVRRRRSA